MRTFAKRVLIAIGVFVSMFPSGCAQLAARRNLRTGTMALFLLTGFGVLAPGLFALIFAAYQSRSSVAEFWRTFYRMFFFYVMLGAPIMIGLYLLYLVLSAFLAPGVLGISGRPFHPGPVSHLAQTASLGMLELLPRATEP